MPKRNGDRGLHLAEALQILACSLLWLAACGTADVQFGPEDASRSVQTGGRGGASVSPEPGESDAGMPDEAAASEGTAGRAPDAAGGAGSAADDASSDAEDERSDDAALGARDAAVLDPCGYPPDDTSDPALPKTRVIGYGFVNFAISTKNEVIDLRTTLAVPAKPPASGTLFLWPGLQPAVGARNYLPIDNGVLQSVLTWGPTCAPRSPASSYASWWISAQYVNTFGRYAGYTGCLGGAGLSVAVGDQLDIHMALAGTSWKQVVTRRATGATATFDIDMLGQAQSYAEFLIEPAGQRPIADVVFTSTSFTMASPEPAACQPGRRGATDDYSTVRVSPDGRTCCVSRIVLRAQGVPATTR